MRSNRRSHPIAIRCHPAHEPHMLISQATLAQTQQHHYHHQTLRREGNEHANPNPKGTGASPGTPEGETTTRAKIRVNPCLKKD